MATADKDLAKLSVQLELQTAAFEAGVKRMDGQLKKMEKNTSRSAKGFDKLNKTLGKVGISFGALAGALSVRAFANATKEAIAFGDNIAKTANKVGVSVEELQELRFAASQSGVDIRQLDMGIQRFARRMGEAAQGTGELLKTTQQLGIEFKNQDGTNKSTVELLEQYAEAVGKAETQQEKLRLAFKAFDSEGAALVNLIGEGSEKMNELRQAAVDLGLVMSTETTVIATQLNDELDILSKTIQTKLNTQLTLAAYGIARLFGKGSNEADIAYFTMKIEEAEKRLKGFTDEMQETGFVNEGQIRNAANLVTAYVLKLQEAGGSYVALAKTVEENPIGPSPAQQEAYQRSVESFVNSINPMNDLAQKLGLIDAALKQVTDPATREALFDLREKLEFGETVDTSLTAIQKFNKEVDALLLSTDSVKAMDDLAAKLGVIEAALRRTTDPEQIEKLMKLWETLAFGEELDPEPIENYAGVAQEALEKIQDAADGFISDFTSELVDGLAEGELAFDDFAKSVLKTIAKIVLNEIFTQFFTAVSGSLFTKSAGVELPETVTASIAQGQGGMTRAGEQATAMTVGRLVSNQSASSVNTSPVTVNVNNYGNDEVSVTERQDSNGGIEIDVLIKNTVRNGFAGGDFDKVMSSTFGARRLGY